MRGAFSLATAAIFAVALVDPAWGDPFFFSTGLPDGKIGTASRTADAGAMQIETADDFVLAQSTSIGSATFTGLLPAGVSPADAARVEIEIYHVFPVDSTDPPSGRVPTRTNSPSDVEIGSATRDSADASLSFSTSDLGVFSVANTVVNGINPQPNQLTLGEGPASGEEVLFSITFNTPLDLAAGHYFFRPEVDLTEGNFLWLSAPKPIVAPGTPFNPDLQSWIRNDDLAPDWLRIGTDITGQGPFNAAFSLSGAAVPEPSTLSLVGVGVAMLLGRSRGRAGR